MSKELLTCEMCSAEWQRPISRGRKPRFCPACIKENVIQLEDLIIVPGSQSANQRSATRWECPSCGEGVTVFVNLSHAPTCRNRTKHSTKSIEMQKVTRKKEAFA